VSTSHIHWVFEHRGIEAADNEACALIGRQAAEMQQLWASRFFERRELDDGTQKLWPTTEERISRAYDLQDLDGEPLPQFFYCDGDGQLYPVTVGKPAPMGADPDGPDEVPLIHASAEVLANGKVVGHVLFTDH